MNSTTQQIKNWLDKINVSKLDSRMKLLTYFIWLEHYAKNKKYEYQNPKVPTTKRIIGV